MQQGILLRVRELKERMTDQLGFADSVELACLFRRLEECKLKWKDWELFCSEASGVKERVERREEEARGRVRREKLSESARVVGRVGDDSVRFMSSRGFKSLS